MAVTIEQEKPSNSFGVSKRISTQDDVIQFNQLVDKNDVARGLAPLPTNSKSPISTTETKMIGNGPSVQSFSFPLQQTNVQVKICDLISHVTVFQQFLNSSNEIIEAKYLFPLEANGNIIILLFSLLHTYKKEI
mgnify:CR=1 FL=1